MASVLVIEDDQRIREVVASSLTASGARPYAPDMGRARWAAAALVIITAGPLFAATKLQDVFPTITTGYAYPWEDIKLKG